MSFQLIIEIEGLNNKEANSIINICSIQDSFPVYKIKHWKLLKVKKIDLGIFNSEILTDNAEYNYKYWDMDLKHINKLINTLKLINDISSILKFRAMWIGEKPIEEVEIPFEELINIISQNKLGTKTSYKILAK